MRESRGAPPRAVERAHAGDRHAYGDRRWPCRHRSPASRRERRAGDRGRCSGHRAWIRGLAAVRLTARSTLLACHRKSGWTARVLLVTGGASLATSLLFGLFPAYQATRINLREALVQSGGNVAGPANRWPRRLLVVAQVALGVVLLVGAGLMIRTFESSDESARWIR